MVDFEFNRTTVEIERVSGNRVATRRLPAAGTRVGVIYLNASNGLAAIQSRLDEIAALCDEYQQLDWVATAYTPDLVPGVNIVITALDNITPEIP